jgi:hypothetical protein
LPTVTVIVAHPLFDDAEDDLDTLEINDIGFPRLRYVRSDHFHDMDEFTFYRRFRLTKQTLYRLGDTKSLAFPNDLVQFEV